MAEQIWTVCKTCDCGTEMSVTYTINPERNVYGYDADNCYTGPRARSAFRGAFYCSGCAKRHDKRGFHEKKKEAA